MNTDLAIFGIIEDEIIKNYGYNCFLSRQYIIMDKIAQLQPSKPEDQSTGYIAYSVPGKDRMKMKTTRFLTRKLNLNSGFLPDKVICQIADRINNDLFGNNGIEVKLLAGCDITQAYRDEIGSHSCMTGDCADFTRFYEMNPDRFQMLVMLYQNDSARAILSKLDNGKYYLDRVYASSEYLREKMYEHARQNGWYDYEGRSPAAELVVSNLDYDDDSVPYMDTFQNGCTCGRGLTISVSGCCDHELTSTDGTLGSLNSCASCGCSVHDDECYYAGDENYCADCYCEIFTTCECCSEDIVSEDTVYIRDIDVSVCEDCSRRHYNVVQCEHCNDNFERAYIEIEWYYICNSCAESINYDTCADCEESFYPDNLTQHSNGNYYCEDCLPDEPEDEIELITCRDYPGQLEINYDK